MIIQRQRYYSLGSDLKYSGLRRTINKYIGKARRKAGDKLEESIRKDLRKGAETSRKYKSTPSIFNQEIEKDLNFKR